MIPAREITGAVYASVFQGQAAIVRPQIVFGHELRASGSASTPRR